jgi:hypothetical protein
MITSEANRGWDGDVTISDLREAGPPIAPRSDRQSLRPSKRATP